MQATQPASPSAPADYSEIRQHELRKSRLVMVDGNVTLNSRTDEGGTSARLYRGGYWGFAAVPGAEEASAARVLDQAVRNAQAMARFGPRASRVLPGGSYRGEHAFRGRTPLTQSECLERLADLHAWCAARYPDLVSTQFMLQDEQHTKHVVTSVGSRVLNSIQRATCHLTLTAFDAQGAPVELLARVSGKGSLVDLDLSPEGLGPLLERTHEHLQAKRRAVPARAGLHTVVMGPELAGILAHEAMGHPCEADLVLAGAVTRDLLGRQVASELVTMVDLAHTFRGEETMCPVYADDEGTQAQDATLIEAGRLTGYMSSRETAARLGIAATGSARAYGPGDEPLVRMRNTAILPGTSKLDDMIAGVDDGYLLLTTSNGQADSTTEFMFGVSLGYEIQGGRIGRAIRDNTVSGSALKVLASVDAVSDDMVWTCAGYCGKKQPMVVSMGGPALRAQAQLGGQ